MQPLPTGAFPEEAAEETPVQPESEPKVLDPEEDLLCIARTFSYLRESGESQGSCRPCHGKSVEELSSLDFVSGLGSMVLPPRTNGRDTHLQGNVKEHSTLTYPGLVPW